MSLEALNDFLEVPFFFFRASCFHHITDKTELLAYIHVGPSQQLRFFKVETLLNNAFKQIMCLPSSQIVFSPEHDAWQDLVFWEDQLEGLDRVVWWKRDLNLKVSQVVGLSRGKRRNGGGGGGWWLVKNNKIVSAAKVGALSRWRLV